MNEASMFFVFMLASFGGIVLVSSVFFCGYMVGRYTEIDIIAEMMK